ncbi:MAG: hypothetical protein U1E29_18555 [Coriobacteriia bacterium]|nr:hypothetical protein [Coriobacteriia bacterium]
MPRNAGTVTRLLVLFVALACLVGCTHPNQPEATESDALPDVFGDYVGWQLQVRMGPVRGEVLTGAGKGQFRDDAGFLITSPDESITLLAWYARTGEDGDVDRVPWVLLDQLYVGDSWKTARAQALHQQMGMDHPNERLLGAYQQSSAADGTEIWHVGYYTEEERRPGQRWERGDHLYEYDPATGAWKMLAEDSGSQNAWNAAGLFEP